MERNTIEKELRTLSEHIKRITIKDESIVIRMYTFKKLNLSYKNMEKIKRILNCENFTIHEDCISAQYDFSSTQDYTYDITNIEK